MFTGIVEVAAVVREAADHAGGRRFVVAHRFGDECRGESVAVNGCCLTVAGLSPDAVAFDVIRETLDKTNLATVRVGDRVHLERSLKPTSRIDGHFVQGHVDGPAQLVRRVATDAEWRLTVRPPADLMAYVFAKGSVCLDGVSLTVASLESDTFDVALIPTTLDRTTLGGREVGWRFNFEADVLAKGVVHTLTRMMSGADIVTGTGGGLPVRWPSGTIPRSPAPEAGQGVLETEPS